MKTAAELKKEEEDAAILRKQVVQPKVFNDTNTPQPKVEDIPKATDSGGDGYRSASGPDKLTLEGQAFADRAAANYGPGGKAYQVKSRRQGPVREQKAGDQEETLTTETSTGVTLANVANPGVRHAGVVNQPIGLDSRVGRNPEGNNGIQAPFAKEETNTYGKQTPIKQPITDLGGTTNLSLLGEGNQAAATNNNLNSGLSPDFNPGFKLNSAHPDPNGSRLTIQLRNLLNSTPDFNPGFKLNSAHPDPNGSRLTIQQRSGQGDNFIPAGDSPLTIAQRRVGGEGPYFSGNTALDASRARIDPNVGIAGNQSYGDIGQGNTTLNQEAFNAQYGVVPGTEDAVRPEFVNRFDPQTLRSNNIQHFGGGLNPVPETPGFDRSRLLGNTETINRKPAGKFTQLPDGSYDLNSGLSAIDESGYNEDGTANNGIGVPGGGAFTSGLRDQNSSQSQFISANDPLQQEARIQRGRGVGQAPTSRGYYDKENNFFRTHTTPDTRQPFRIDREGPLRGLLGGESGRVSNATIARMAEDKRLGGGAAGRRAEFKSGELGRNVAKLNRQAQQASAAAEQRHASAKAIREAGLPFLDQAQMLVNAEQIAAQDRSTQATATASANRTGALRAKTASTEARALSKTEQEARTADALVTAKSLVPRGTEKEEMDTVVNQNLSYILTHANQVPGYTRQQQNIENQRAVASGQLLAFLSNEAGFSYSSLDDLVQDVGDDTLINGKIVRDPLQFWRAVFEDGPIDAAWGEFTGATEITLPGTSNSISVSEISGILSKFDRSAIKNLFTNRKPGTAQGNRQRVTSSTPDYVSR